MAIRSDVSVDFSASPRIAEVASPSTTITIQDLHDTLRDLESKPWNMSFLKLIDSSGKDDLGGGRQVGITAKLKNARVKFAARSGPTYVQCTVTDGNLVAVDANEASMNPIEPSAFTQVVVQQSTSPSLVGVAAQDIENAVWDALESGHNSSGSFAKQLETIEKLSRAAL